MVTQHDVQTFHTWFTATVHTYYSTDKLIQTNIRLKEEHTHRVCANIKTLGEAFALSPENIFLAETSALFHDLGRFEQFTKYQTFNDQQSINHAQLSVQLLKKHKILDPLPTQEQELIYAVIGYHNMHHFPTIEDETVLFFTQLLRDADKLDVLHVLLAHYQHSAEEKNPALDMNFPDTPEYSLEIIHDILQKRSTKWALVKNLNDMKLLQLSWIYDINFKPTLVEIKKRGYIDTFFSLLPNDDTMKQIRQQIEQSALVQ